MADLQPDTTPATPAKWLAYLSKLKWILPWLPPLLVATVYAGFIYHFFPSHRHQMNPDGVGYIAVAQKYAAGHFAHAVNAYWSPLYSWLLVPLLWIGREPFGVDALLATKLLAVAIGAATLIALWRLLRHAGVQTDLLALAAVAAIPLIVDAAFMVTTPDLLVACCILFYLAARLNPAPPTDGRMASPSASPAHSPISPKPTHSLSSSPICCSTDSSKSSPAAKSIPASND